MTREQRDRELFSQQRAWVGSLVSSAQSKRWYGTITLKIEEGVIRRAVKEESLKPPTYPASSARVTGRRG